MGIKENIVYLVSTRRADETGDVTSQNYVGWSKGTSRGYAQITEGRVSLLLEGVGGPDKEMVDALDGIIDRTQEGELYEGKSWLAESTTGVGGLQRVYVEMIEDRRLYKTLVNADAAIRSMDTPLLQFRDISPPW
ncbi:TPA: hypothetical protein HA278_02095 [Candidatus Woesearchaeota archaeon]|nr:hypothetical protein [archaeon]HIJ10827.1 hypothetical protein [Candidatus Woesearchaeota archaeon]|tara:strand:- start:343 stop:747 length:405 start_codon:yes stop_codon:yes gene_type:complete